MEDASAVPKMTILLPFTLTGQPALLTLPSFICTKSAVMMPGILNPARQLLNIA